MKYFSLIASYDLEAENPLGELFIHCDKGEIVAKCIMLDSFLEAIIVGYSLVCGSNHDIYIDVIDEPEILCFSPGLNEIKIRYGAQFGVVDNKLLFGSDLREVVIQFLDIFDSDSISKGLKIMEFAALRKYAQ